MLNYEDITEDIIRKYAPSHIVHDFNESINAYIDTNTQQHTWMMGERPNVEELKEVETSEVNQDKTKTDEQIKELIEF